jgi:hypothetical protein
MRLTTVATFDDPAQAHLARTSLETSGILCFVVGEHPNQSERGWTELQVPEDAEATAREILAGGAPEALAGEDGGGHGLVRVAAFRDLADAHAAAAALDAAGIPHSLTEEDPPGGGDTLALHTEEEDAGAAAEVLRGSALSA